MRLKKPLSLLASPFVRDSGTLLSGNVVAQGIAFVAYLLLTRLFTPDDFGLYNTFYSYIEVFIILSTLKYELAIVRADSDAEAHALTHLTLRLNTALSLLLLLVAVPVALWGGSALPLPPALVLLIPFLVFFSGTTRVYTFLFNRFQHFRHIATNSVVASLGGVLFKVGFGLLAPLSLLLHTLGLPLGTILGTATGNLYYRWQAARLPRPPSSSPLHARHLLRKHRNFPLYAAPRELVSSLSANLPFLWLSIYFPDSLIGLFALAFTFTMRPINLLANAFEKVFYSNTSQRLHQRLPIGPSVRRFLLTLNAAVLPVALLGFFFAEPLFTFLFGSKWVGTGFYVRCLAPWVVVLLSANSLAFVANVFSTQRADFLLQSLQLLLRVAALWVGISRADFRLAILLFCAVSTLMQLVQLGWYLFQTHRYDRSLASNPS